MKTKLMMSILFIFFVCPFIINADERPEISVFINGDEKEFTVDPYTHDGVAFVPIRTFDFVGEITWNDELRSAVLQKDDIILEFFEGENVINKDDTKIELSSSIQIIDGNMMIPVRFVGELLDLIVGWDTYTQTIIISDKPDRSEKYVNDVKSDLIIERIKDDGEYGLKYKYLYKLIGVTNLDDQAVQYTTELIKNKNTFVILGQEDIGENNTTLSYIFLENGTFLNAILISKGLAKVDTNSINTMWHDLFNYLEDDAKSAKRGVWGNTQ
ncbi:stalk domain-containing protein [Longirhabdus pacifica]|uniref:stalk domain-containing protein n=1 Tax=Longirhabdus pacifica TaxID=2305227 RepID=UPI0010091D0A|nr:stalk domain-containing protein [Longirhabdus pacifica]